MFNIILALSAGILIGWNFHAFFLALDVPHFITNDINISQKTIPKLILDLNNSTSVKIKEKVVPYEKPMQTSFYSLLHNNLFDGSMALYRNASHDRTLLYRATLNSYFKKKSHIDEEKTIHEMLTYIEIEPENETTKLLLVELYKKRKEYVKSIQLIKELIDSTSNSDNESLYQNLVGTSESHINTLKESKNYKELELFLKAQIEHGIESPFFIFTLAKHYVFMQSYDPAIILLKEIEFDEEYGEKAKALLNSINHKESGKNEYTHKLSLTQKGSHFTIDVSIDETPLTLLLDTGATLTMINEDKLSSLTLINDNVTLKTAAGEISAQLQMAKKLTVGNIELKNFKVTTSSFSQENADGLLGMNFFKQFKFKIDQENKILYLSEK